jgi:hypothetical protein
LDCSEFEFSRNSCRSKDTLQSGGDDALRPVGIGGPPTFKEQPMPKFVIERNIPGAGKLAPAELQAISATSCGVLRDLGPSIQWVHSYVTDDRIYCVYNAPDEALVRKHAQQGGFPADVVAQVRRVIDPVTAEA